MKTTTTTTTTGHRPNRRREQANGALESNLPLVRSLLLLDLSLRRLLLLHTNALYRPLGLLQLPSDLPSAVPLLRRCFVNRQCPRCLRQLLLDGQPHLRTSCNNTSIDLPTVVTSAL
jgi:hypothetical protein